ncbi:MAG: helix-turn-helix domain-containing protein [Steroidobacteraceae bacterium]|jgi:transcriptional regulator with XRE-family HTH domain
MKPSEFRELLDGAGLSQSEVARQLEISDRTVRRYLAGRAPVPTLVVRAVMHLITERQRPLARNASSSQRGRHNG